MADRIRSIDLAAAWAGQRAELEAAMHRVLDSGRYVLGPEVRRFEEAFAEFCGGGEAVGVGNGTDAITLALMALGVGEGDAVITVSHTAVASAVGILRAGAVPVFVDIDPRRYTMAPAALGELLAGWRTNAAVAGLRPRAVMPVHLYGQPADMAAIGAIAEEHSLTIIEDCAQAHGAALDGRPAGAFGQAATFSFYPTKNLGAFGDGGAVLVHDPSIAEALRGLRQYGWKTRYVSDAIGMNSRLDELQAALLSVRLGSLAAENARRREIAAIYDRILSAAPSELLRRPEVGTGVSHAWHQYVVATTSRDELKEHLTGEGIETPVHYPVPIHLQPAYRVDAKLTGAGLPETERAAREVLSLPIHPWLSDDLVARVAAAVLRFLG
jgi:dTDP-4-amino-4,6-dideoxygalactose transaminase